MNRIFQGIDLVSIPKLQRVMAKHPAFLDEIFAVGERAYCLAKSRPYLHLADRFAVKEACLKALGQGLSTTGFGQILQEIELVAHPCGPPQLLLHGWAAALSKKRRIVRQAVSISHSGDFAVAIVILTGMDHPR